MGERKLKSKAEIGGDRGEESVRRGNNSLHTMLQVSNNATLQLTDEGGVRIKGPRQAHCGPVRVARK